MTYIERDNLKLGLAALGEDEFAQKVALANTDPIPVAVTVLAAPNTSVLTMVDVSDSEPVTVLEANPVRLGASWHNHSDSQLYMSLSDTVSEMMFTQVMQPHSFYELPFPVFLGVVTALRPSGSGSGPVMITELSAVQNV